MRTNNHTIELTFHQKSFWESFVPQLLKIGTLKHFIAKSTKYLPWCSHFHTTELYPPLGPTPTPPHCSTIHKPSQAMQFHDP